MPDDPEIGDYVRLVFYDHLFDSDDQTETRMRERRWVDLYDPNVKHKLPVREQDGYVVEWTKERIILRVGRSSDNEDMAWFIVPDTVVSWKPF